MGIGRAVIATTHVDKHGEQLALSALESMVEQSRANIIPVFLEHDPRNAPIGRTLDAEVRKRSDGEYELVTTFEYFDKRMNLGHDGSPVDKHDHREIKFRNYPATGIQLVWDHSYSDPIDQRLLRDLADSGSPRMMLVEAHKKALDPISILILGGVYVFGKIAEGMFSKIGSDTWEGFKNNLGRIINKKRVDTGEAVLQLDFDLSTETDTYNVSVFATNPKESDIDALFDRHIRQLDSLVAKTLETNREIRVIVFEYRDTRLLTKYVIRRNGVPMMPQTGNSDEPTP